MENVLTPKRIAWLLPASLLAHQLEEYFGGFPLWYSTLLNVDLSNEDFILINGIGLAVISVLSFSYLFNKNNMILVALGTLIFTNGVIHLALTVLTIRYSPGVVTGVVFFLPLGTLIYQNILPQLSEGKRLIAIGLGVVGLFSVSLLAMNM